MKSLFEFWFIFCWNLAGERDGFNMFDSFGAVTVVPVVGQEDNLAVGPVGRNVLQPVCEQIE
jgi:hypothetical protein